MREPVILHWLGPMFDPALEGYWGAASIPEATENCLGIIQAHKERIDGIKISLLDADLEISMRRRLPQGVRMYTGDDFNYDRLILVTNKATATPFWESSMPSHRPRRWHWLRSMPETFPATNNCSRLPYLSHGTYSRHPRNTTRQALFSWHS